MPDGGLPIGKTSGFATTHDRLLLRTLTVGWSLARETTTVSDTLFCDFAWLCTPSAWAKRPGD